MPVITPEFWENIRNKMRELDVSGNAKVVGDYLSQNVKRVAEDVIPKPTKLSEMFLKVLLVTHQKQNQKER